MSNIKMQLQDIRGVTQQDIMKMNDNFKVLFDKLNGKLDGKDLEDSTITSTQIADNAVKEDNIEDGAITTAKVAAGCITATELADGTVTADKIAYGTIKEQHMNLNTHLLF